MIVSLYKTQLRYTSLQVSHGWYIVYNKPSIVTKFVYCNVKPVVDKIILFAAVYLFFQTMLYNLTYSGFPSLFQMVFIFRNAKIAYNAVKKLLYLCIFLLKNLKSD